MSGIHVTPGAQEAGIRALSRQAVVELFSGLDRQTTVNHLSRINCAIGNGGLFEHSFQRWLVSSFLQPERIERINAFICQRQPRQVVPVFHPRQLRMAIKLALQHSRLSGGATLESEDVRFEIGDALLSMQEAFLETSPLDAVPQESLEYKLALELQMQQGCYLGPPSLALEAGLHNQIDAMILQDHDIRGHFEGTVGCSPEEYYAAVFALTAHFRTLTPAYVMRSSRLCDPRYVFGTCGIPKRVGAAVLERVAFPASDPPPVGSLEGKASDYADFGLFVRRPYVWIDENALGCVDVEFAWKHLARCLHVALDESLGPSHHYAKRGGHFEDVCSHAFGSLARERAACGARWIPPGTYSGVEVDGIYEEGGVALLIEAKSGLVRTDAKLTTNVALLAGVLCRKYVGVAYDKGEGSGEGLSQLARKAAAVLDVPRRFPLPETVRAVFPVLVVEDPFVANKMPTEFVLAMGRGLFDRKAEPRLRAPQVISFEVLVMMWERSGAYAPSDFLFCAEKGLGGYLDMRDMIARKFPIEGVSGLAHVPEVTFNRHFLNSGYGMITNRFKGTDIPVCPCGMSYSVIDEPPNNLRWMCSKCGALGNSLTPGEYAMLQEAAARAVERYEAS